MVDSYPVYIGNSWAGLNECRTKAQATKALVENDANTASDVFYIVPQGQGWNEDGHNCKMSYNMDDPTMHQLRYNAMSPMIWGAKGIIFWAYAYASRRGNQGDPADSWVTVHRFTQWFKSSSFYGNLGNIYGTTPEPGPPSGDGAWINFRTKAYTLLPTFHEYFIFSVNEDPVIRSGNTPGYVTVPALPSGWFKIAEELQYDANNPVQTYNVPHTISSDNKINTTWYSFEIKIFRVRYYNFSKTNNSKQIKTEIPSDYMLYSNYPNPFNPVTHIRYDLPKESLTSLAIYDVLGHKVKVLVNEIQNAGSYIVQWDGTDESGNFIGSGTYLLKMVSGNYKNTRKLLLMK